MTPGPARGRSASECADGLLAFSVLSRNTGLAALSAARGRLEFVTRLVGQCGRIDVMSFPAAPTEPRGPCATVTGSAWTSSVTAMACAAARSTMRLRRSSPCCSASASGSRRARGGAASRGSSGPSRARPAPWRALALLAVDLHLLELREMTQLRLERIASACTSVSENRVSVRASARPQRRMMRIAS